MRIDKYLQDDYCILSLKGEFDVFYVPSLQEEVESLLENGVSHLVLNMRLVKFINSTALGAIIRFHRLCRAANGELVIAQPSSFVKDVVNKVGIDQIVQVFDEQEAAVKHLIKALNALELAGAAPVNQEKIMIAFPDETRVKQVGGKQPLVGNMGNVNGERIQFLWSGAKLDLALDGMKQLFFAGSELDLKFQVKMFKRGYFELRAEVVEVESAGDDTCKVTARFTQITDADRDALSQFAADMEFLKRQLPN